MSTIRDVAALANVSAATVSRVLNHDTKYKMTEETIERVWKAVAELGYKAPTSSQDQMRYVHRPEISSQNTHKFGCILNVQGGKYNDPYYLSILSGFEEAVMKKGYEISFIRTNQELENPKVLYSTFQNPVSGVIIMNTLEESTFSYLKNQTPYIVGIDTDHTDIDNIAYDHYGAAFMAIQHLMSRGYKRIGFIGGFAENMKTSRRYNGYYSALHCFNLEYNPEWVLASNWDEEHCESVIREAYEKKVLPDAYFVASDLMAIGVLRTLFDLGVKVPEQVAVIGLSNIEISKYSNPPLSTIALPIHDMGRVAARTLFDRIEGDDTPAKVVTLSAEVLRRSST